MVKSLFLSLFLFCSLLGNAATISVAMASGPCKLYLASYYGNGVQVLDSLTMCDGEAVWITERVLGEGIYFLTDKKQSGRFEFLIGVDQDFEIELKSLKSDVACVTGAEESEIFRAYQNFVQDVDGSKEEKVAYTRSLCEKAKEGSVLKLILQAMVPPPGRMKSSSLLVINEDAVDDYNALHFWDNFDLSDKRLVRTPFFASRVNMFLRQILPPREDKIMLGVLPLLRKAEQDDEVLKIVASAVLNLAIENRIMGIDALGYEVITRYYISGRFGELPDQQVKMLEDYVAHTAYCRVGHKGREIKLNALEPEKGEVSLYAVEAPYVLLLFWEPDCDYCKVLLPTLRDNVYAKYRDHGLEVFAVNTQRDYEKWKNYIIENELFDWHHGYQAVGASNFMSDYGIQGTPFMYILDKDKNIVAKNVKLEHLEMMFERLFSLGSIY